MVRCTAKKTTLERVGQDCGDGSERMVTRLAFKCFVATAMAQSSIAHNVRYTDAITYSQLWRCELIEELQNAGFQFVGDWIADTDGIKLNFQPPKGLATVYLFVLDGQIVYVGLTQTCMRGRMHGYRKGQKTQRTNVRVRKSIVEALAAGHRVQIMAASPEQLEWHGLPVNTAVGLESGLIAKIKPLWNLLNKHGSPVLARL
jgi:hypothetical protein